MMLAATLSASAWAHHSRNNFDLETVLEFQGVITEYSWRNPLAFSNKNSSLSSFNPLGRSSLIRS